MAFDAAEFDAEHHATHHATPGRDPAYDPIVEEVRAVREALFAEAGYDLEEFWRQLRASEAADGVTSVVRPPPWPSRAP